MNRTAKYISKEAHAIAGVTFFILLLVWNSALSGSIRRQHVEKDTLLSSPAISIIPMPAFLQPGTSGTYFNLSPEVKVFNTEPSFQQAFDFFSTYVKNYYGIQLTALKSTEKQIEAWEKKEKEGNSVASILVIKKSPSGKPGSYRLKIDPHRILIEASEPTGVFYATQTLLQVLDAPKENKKNITQSGPEKKKVDREKVNLQPVQIPTLEIKDEPRYAYRGVMLDVSRHYFPVSFIKKFIDQAALHKLNTLHWHLTEDQGWRIEIKRYPELTKIGAFRNGTIVGHHPGTGNTNERYGGFYTQEEVKEIVAYAAKRYITIIPEIEMPGHASAAIASIPSLSCFPNLPTDMGKNASEKSKQLGGKQVQEQWGVFRDVFCAGKDSVFIFLQNVLDEVVQLFPSSYVHIGGDECPKENWKSCSNCQKRIQELKLKDEHELQSYFVQRIEKYLNSKGKKLIGWDEILEGGLAPNATVMSWRGEQGGIAAAKEKHDVIMTPNPFLYFDYYQGNPKKEPLAIGGFLPLEKVYSYNPTPTALSEEEQKYVIGVQANLWTEYIPTQEKAEYMAFPRLAALSEVAWSPLSAKNWEHFGERMYAQMQRYELWDIKAAPIFFDVHQIVQSDSKTGRTAVTLSCDAPGVQILYTTDGSEPTMENKQVSNRAEGTKVYSNVLSISRTTVVKAAAFRMGKKLGRTSVQKIEVN